MMNTEKYIYIQKIYTCDEKKKLDNNYEHN